MLRRYHSGRALVTALCIVSTACSAPDFAVSDLNDEPELAVQWAGNPQLAQAISALRDTTDQYHDVTLAVAAGYRPSAAGCESSETGAMGIHYGHSALLGVIRGSNPVTGTDPNINPLRPEVLMYEPQLDGSRRLVGVEFVVYKAAWDAVNSQPPTFYGVPFDVKTGHAAHGHADHYELHLWLWRHNPLGMFSPWNPKVECL